MNDISGDPPQLTTAGTIGVTGVLSIGVGAIVGGGFFATFGLTILGAKGATPLAFLLAGLIALLTAYAYIGLTLRYPGPGGTVSFINKAFGTGLFAGGVNVLLILSYVAIMSVYAAALASYSVPYLPEPLRPAAFHVIASLAIILLGWINLLGAKAMQQSEHLFNFGKLFVLLIFIGAGLLVGRLDWARLAPAAWPAPTTIVANGMLGFLAYEGFELIANASGDVRNPRRTLPIGFLGSVLIAIAIYLLAFVVGVTSLPISSYEQARDFAISASAESFLGPAGFAIMALGGILASASAINADYFGAGRLPDRLAAAHELPSIFQQRVRTKSTTGLITIGVLSLAAVNLLSLQALSAATSGGFLLVYATVNLAAFRLADTTGARRWLVLVAMTSCLVALVVTMVEFLSSPSTIEAAASVVGIVAISFLIEIVHRSMGHMHVAGPSMTTSCAKEDSLH
ncbi:APC family permease [Bradyrhizobium sp. USDA 4353]